MGSKCWRKAAFRSVPVDDVPPEYTCEEHVRPGERLRTLDPTTEINMVCQRRGA